MTGATPGQGPEAEDGSLNTSSGLGPAADIIELDTGEGGRLKIFVPQQGGVDEGSANFNVHGDDLVRLEYVGSAEGAPVSTFFVSRDLLETAVNTDSSDTKKMNSLLGAAVLASRRAGAEDPIEGAPAVQGTEVLKLETGAATATGIAAVDVREQGGVYTTSLRATNGACVTISTSQNPCENFQQLLRAGSDLDSQKLSDVLDAVVSASNSSPVKVSFFPANSEQSSSTVTFLPGQGLRVESGSEAQNLSNSSSLSPAFLRGVQDFIDSGSDAAVTPQAFQNLVDGTLSVNIRGQSLFALKEEGGKVSLRLGSPTNSEVLKVTLRPDAAFPTAKEEIQRIAETAQNATDVCVQFSQSAAVSNIDTARLTKDDVKLILGQQALSFETRDGSIFSVEASGDLKSVLKSFHEAQDVAAYTTKAVTEKLEAGGRVECRQSFNREDWVISIDAKQGEVNITIDDESHKVRLADETKSQACRELLNALRSNDLSKDDVIDAVVGLSGVSSASYEFNKTDDTRIKVNYQGETVSIRNQNKGGEFVEFDFSSSTDLKVSDYLRFSGQRGVVGFEGHSLQSLNVSDFSLNVQDGVVVRNSQHGAEIVSEQSKVALRLQSDDPSLKIALVDGCTQKSIGAIEAIFAEKFRASESASLDILDAGGNTYVTITKTESNDLLLTLAESCGTAVLGEIDDHDKLGHLIGQLRIAAENDTQRPGAGLLAALGNEDVKSSDLSLHINGIQLGLKKSESTDGFKITGVSDGDRVVCRYNNLSKIPQDVTGSSDQSFLARLPEKASSISAYEVGGLKWHPDSNTLNFESDDGANVVIKPVENSLPTAIPDLLGRCHDVVVAVEDKALAALKVAVQDSEQAGGHRFTVEPPFPASSGSAPTTQAGGVGGGSGGGGGVGQASFDQDPDEEGGFTFRSGDLTLRIKAETPEDLEAIRKRLNALERIPNQEDRDRERFELLQGIFSDAKYDAEAKFNVASGHSTFQTIKVSSKAYTSTVRVDFESKKKGDFYDGGSFSLNGETEKDGRLAQLFRAFANESGLESGQPTQIVDAISALKRPANFNNVVLKLQDSGVYGSRVLKLAEDSQVGNRLTVSLLDLNEDTDKVMKTRLSFFSDTGLQTDIAADPLIAKLNLFGRDARRAVSGDLDLDQRDAMLLEELTRDSRQIVLREANLELRGMQHPDASESEANRMMRVELDGEKYIVTFRHQGSWESKDDDYATHPDKETRAQFENASKLHALAQAVLKETGKTRRPSFGNSPDYRGFMADKWTNNILLSIVEHAEKVEKMWFKLPDSRIDPYPEEVVQQRQREVHITYDEANKKNQIYLDGKLSGAFRDATCIVNGEERSFTDELYAHDLYNDTIAGESNDQGYSVRQHVATAGKFGHKLEVHQTSLFAALKDPLVRVTDLGAEPGLMEKTILRGGAYPLNFSVGLRRGPNAHDVGLVEFYTDGSGFAYAKFHAPKGGNALHPEPTTFVFRDGSVVANAVDAIYKFNKDVAYPPHRAPGTGEKRLEDLLQVMTQLGGEVVSRTENINVDRRGIKLGPNHFVEGDEAFSKSNSPIKSAVITESNGVSQAVVEIYDVGRSGAVGMTGQTQKVTLRLDGNTSAGMKAFNDALIVEREFRGDPRKSEFFTRMSKGGWRFEEIEKGAHVYLTSNSNVTPEMSTFGNLKKFNGTIHMFSPNFHELQITGETHGYQKQMTAKFISNGGSGKGSHIAIDFLSDEFSDGIVDAAKAFRADMYTDSSSKIERGVLYVGKDSEVENLMWRAINSNQMVVASGCNMQLFLRKTISRDQDFSNLYFDSCIMEVVYEGAHIERLKHDNVNRLLQRLAPKTGDQKRSTENSIDFIGSNLRPDMVISDVRLGAIQIDSAKTGGILKNFTLVNCEADRLLIGHNSPLGSVQGLMVTGCTFYGDKSNPENGIVIRAGDCGFGNAIVNSTTESITIDAAKINGLDLRGTTMPPPNFTRIDGAYERSLGFWPDERETQAYQKYLEGVVFSPGCMQARDHVERTRMRNIKRSFKWYNGLAWYMNPNMHVQYGANRIDHAVAMMDKSKVQRSSDNTGTVLGGSLRLDERVRGRGMNNQVLVSVSQDQASRHPGLRAGQYELNAAAYVASMTHLGQAAKDGHYGAVSNRLESLSRARYDA